MNLKIALAGNPNCGKTTLFNELTGSNQYVGNWPGVTVEKKEGKLKKQDGVIITDLPGIYSLSPYTLEEVVARNYLIDEKPDAILNIVDGTNLERNLYLTTQLSELGIPVVVAINMMDIVRKNGDKIDIEKLSIELGCKVVEISALKGDGTAQAAEAAIEAAKSKRKIRTHMFSGTVEHALAHIEEATVHNLSEVQQRWYSIKLFERDKMVIEKLQVEKSVLDHIEKDIREVELELDDDAESIITNERYNYIEQILKGCYVKKRKNKMTLSDRIDNIVTNKFLALPIFVLVMFCVYALSIGTVGDWTLTFMNDGLFGSFKEAFAGTFMENWVSVPEFLDKLFVGADGNIIISEWLYSLIKDGIVGGVGAVLGFVPQMIILFLLLSLLEDCGYMSRIAFILDRVFRKFGLSGKSFIPLLVATGCGVPGVMASRTIESERDRRMTVMTTCFIPCSAKVPIISMIAGALFGGSPIIATAAYLIGIASVIVSGLILKKTKPFAGDAAAFVMELPAYHMPVAKNVLRTTFERGWSFIKRAGTVVLAASVIVWILNSLSFEGGFHYITGDEKSILNVVGSWFAVVFKPLGFGDWKMAVATVLGLVAKEEVVGVLGSLASMAATEATQYTAIGEEIFANNSIVGLSFLMFNLLCAPCFAAMGAIKNEMNSAKWTFAAIGYMTGFAYVVSLMIYQFGLLIAEGSFTFWTAVAFAVLAFMIYMLVRKNKYNSNSLKK